jgi:hypothetical protein
MGGDWLEFSIEAIIACALVAAVIACVIAIYTLQNIERLVQQILKRIS